MTSFARHASGCFSIPLRCIAPLCAPASLFLVLLVTAGCGKPHAMQFPPAAVTVSKPVERKVTEWDEYTGRLESPEVANISARVSGFIESAPFKEGALVHKGDVLFIIDDRPFKADLDNKRAAVARDAAQLTLAQLLLARDSSLLKKLVVAQQDYDNAKAAADQAVAQLAADKAAEVTSDLNLQWTRVTAPFTGRISRMSVTVGNLVNGGAGSATLLTNLVAVDPVYCYVPVPERSYLNYAQFARKEKHASLENAKIPCFMELENETGFPHHGAIDFIDNSVDPATGTIQLRGVFPNPDGELTPGLFARMRIPGGAPSTTILVPDAAVGTQQNERYLLVVGSNNIVMVKPVKLGTLFGSLRAITDGLNPGDRVIVDGLQQARPGTPVVPTEVPISAESLEALSAESPDPSLAQASLPSPTPPPAP